MAPEESSVLFSLHELRSLEEERIREEEEFARARAVAEQRLREEEERRAREEAEARAREAEEARVRAELERQRQLLEEKRLARESELRRQAEQQAAVEAARVEAETRAMLALEKKPFPAAKVLAASLLAVGAVVVFASLQMQRRDNDLARQQQAMAQRFEEDAQRADAQRAAERKKFEATLGELERRLQAAKSESERVTVQKQLDAHKKAHARVIKPTAPATKPGMKINAKDLDDPTAGLDLLP